MLFLLTGDVQTGKTRWLERLVAQLAMAGTPCVGVVAPGVWRERAEDEPDGEHGTSCAGRFEKLGINNLLLPQKEVIPFARRRDLAEAEAQAGGDSSFAEGRQAGEAQLGWAISDEAIARVNQHFADVDGIGFSKPALLLVDELGRLELLHGQGLTEALRVLDAGPSEARPHALVVVRDTLVDIARERLAGAWRDVRVIGPTDEAMELIVGLMLSDF